MKDLESVLKKFLNAQKVLASEEILMRLAYEACVDAYNENVVMLELRYSPSFINDGHKKLNHDKIHNHLLQINSTQTIPQIPFQHKKRQDPHKRTHRQNPQIATNKKLTIIIHPKKLHRTNRIILPRTSHLTTKNSVIK